MTAESGAVAGVAGCTADGKIGTVGCGSALNAVSAAGWGSTADAGDTAAAETAGVAAGAALALGIVIRGKSAGAGRVTGFWTSANVSAVSVSGISRAVEAHAFWGAAARQAKAT